MEYDANDVSTETNSNQLMSMADREVSCGDVASIRSNQEASGNGNLDDADVLLVPNIHLLPVVERFDLYGLTASRICLVHRRAQKWIIGQDCRVFIKNMKKEFPEFREEYFVGLYDSFIPLPHNLDVPKIRPTKKTDVAFLPDNAVVVVD